MNPSIKGLDSGFRTPRRVLVRAANWVGDAVMMLPALASVRRGLPGSHISILTKPWVADLFRGSSLVDEVILYQSPGKHEGLRGKWNLARELKKGAFDLAILFQNAFEAAMISFLAGIPARAGYDTDARRILLTRAVPVNEQVKKGHQVDYYREMVKGLGFESAESVPSLAVSNEQMEEAGRILGNLGLREAPHLVGLGPGAAYGPAKQWFPERFGELAERLSRELGARILVFGSRGDKPAASLVSQNSREPVVDLTGQTRLGQAMGLMARCSLFISNDSGLMHVAAALGVPVVAIFGSTDPVRTGPRGQHCRIVRKPLPCAPCLKTHCPQERECMKQITVDEVFEEARKFWNS